MRTKPLLLALLIALLSPCLHAQTTYDLAVRHFAYDHQIALGVRRVSVAQRGDVTVYDLTYAGSAGPVPAYLVVPAGKHLFAAVIWAHWLMPGSPMQNRGEFLDEAVALAPAGMVSLLIDAPQNRPGFIEDQDPLGAQISGLLRQEVIDLRRGLDLLLSRSDVDSTRIGFVGHSFGSASGAVLDAVEKRFAAFVFMGGPQSIREFIQTSTRPEFLEFRKQVPAAKIAAYLDTYAWADPATYAPHFGPAPELFQYALRDEYVTLPEAKHFLALAHAPKEAKFYDSTHALNAAARADRFAFLKAHLGLAALPAGTLAGVPETH